MGSNIMRVAAAALCSLLPSVIVPLRSACATRPQKYRQIGWKQLVRLSVDFHRNLTLNYLPTEHRLFFQVLVPSAGIRGFLDASEFGSWLKYVRRSKEKQNMRHSLLGGQIFYETIRDVNANEELCLDERQPIQLDNGEEPEKNEDEVKSIVSHEEDELESEENGVKCLVCDKTFPDVYM